MDLSIVILHYKNIKKTRQCLDSVYASDLSNIEFEIIVVDNGSGDDIANVLKNKYPEAILASSKKNLGMGQGNNLGMERAQGEFILILNDDIIITNDAIIILYNEIKNNDKIGIMAPKLLYPDKTYQPSCFRFPGFTTPIFRRTFLGKIFKSRVADYVVSDPQDGRAINCDWIMGSCLMLKKSMLDKIGLFDKRFFMYLEDTDLCRRIWSAGYLVVYNPKAVVIHAHGRGSAKKPWFIAPFTERLAREHIKSWVKYFWKYL